MSTTITVFTDCFDPNASIRQELRYRKIFGDVEVKCKAVNSSIEASGCILDALDALNVRYDYFKSFQKFWPKDLNIIVGNLAPRTKNHYPNGAPFCFGFTDDRQTLVIGTPEVFTLPVKFGVITRVYETDVTDVCTAMDMSKKQVNFIANSQFRSLEYVPLLAHWITMGDTKKLPAKEIKIRSDIFDNQVWWIDNFGNVKVVATKNDFTTGSFQEISESGIRVLPSGLDEYVPFYNTLKDVPYKEYGIVEGSSGYGESRLLELVIKGDSAASNLGLKLYTQVFDSVVFATD